MSRVEYFEQQIRNSSCHDDPLVIYLEYLSYLEQQNPDRVMNQYFKKGHILYCESEQEESLTARDYYVALLELTTKVFKADSRYKQNLNYLKVWIKFSHQVDSPADVFAYLEGKGIGSELALFYEEYARVCVKSLHRRDKAIQVLKRGVQKNAQPIDRLRASYKAMVDSQNVDVNDLAGGSHENQNPNIKMVDNLVSKSSNRQDTANVQSQGEVHGYDTNLVVNSQGRDQSFEEARSLKYRRVVEQFRAQKLQQQQKSRVAHSAANDATQHNDTALSQIMSVFSTGGNINATLSKYQSDDDDDDDSFQFCGTQTNMTAISAITNLADDEVEKTCTIIERLPVQKLFNSALEVYEDEQPSDQLTNQEVPQYERNDQIKPFQDDNDGDVLQSKQDEQEQIRVQLERDQKEKELKEQRRREERQRQINRKLSFAGIKLKAGTALYNDDEDDEAAANDFQSPKQCSSGGTNTSPCNGVPEEERDSPFRETFKQYSSAPQNNMFLQDQASGANEKVVSARVEDYEDMPPPAAVPTTSRGLDIMTPIAEMSAEYKSTNSKSASSASRLQKSSNSKSAHTSSTGGSNSLLSTMSKAGDNYSLYSIAETNHNVTFGLMPRQGQLSVQSIVDHNHTNFTLNIPDIAAIPDPTVSNITSHYQKYPSNSLINDLTLDATKKFQNLSVKQQEETAFTVVEWPDKQRILTFLKQQMSVITSSGKFNDMSGMKFGKGGAISKTMSTKIHPHMTISLGAEEYIVMKKLGEGQYGAVYLSQHADEDLNGQLMKVAMKIHNSPSCWEFYIMEQLAMRSDHPVDKLQFVSAHNFYLYQDESYLIMDYAGKGTLLDAVNRCSKATIGGGGMDELLVMFFTIELLRMVDRMHQSGIIHGDIKPDNFLLRMAPPVKVNPLLESMVNDPWISCYEESGCNGWLWRGLLCVDFGQSVDLSMFKKDEVEAVKFQTSWRSKSNSGHGKAGENTIFDDRLRFPWRHDIDYVGLAGCVFVMLFGKYWEVPQRLHASHWDSQCYFDDLMHRTWKRYWHKDIWVHLFKVLLSLDDSSEGDAARDLDFKLQLFKLKQIRHEMETFLADNCEKNGKSLKQMLSQL
ncbi:hypothetical protein MIR68_000096 [Amoeboaphelidium protococcarum]|nr:hypothetical protein MIR68_000096 [Amoeboaphelidium protococcarum]